MPASPAIPARPTYGLRPFYRMENRIKTARGDWVWVLSRGRVVERDSNGRALRMTGTNVDITQRKRAEVELLSALQREKELSEMKSKFVSIASHELRTPLATILSSAELLEHYADGLSADDKLKMLHGIQNGVKRMNAMIEDVLIIGKAEAGALQYDPKYPPPASKARPLKPPHSSATGKRESASLPRIVRPVTARGSLAERIRRQAGQSRPT